MAEVDQYAQKRSVIRVVGLHLVTSGLYGFYWFYAAREKLKGILQADDNVGLQTVGLIVPVLQAFIIYWLFRDINKARQQVSLPTFPAGWYVVLPYILFAAAAVIGIGALISLIGGIASLSTGGDTGVSNAAAVGGGIGLLFALLLYFAAAITGIVFYCLAISKYNEYWDTISKGKASEARFGQGEIIIIVIGIVLFALNMLSGALSSGRSSDNQYRPNTDYSTNSTY